MKEVKREKLSKRKTDVLSKNKYYPYTYYHHYYQIKRKMRRFGNQHL